MAQWQKIKITRENGEEVDSQAPIIISASRSTDIPAFYADWFFHRHKQGYSAWTNPFNGVKSYVSYKNARFFVFWSKNPKPLLNHIDELKKMNFYIQFTLNDYVSEGLEKGVPPLEDRIETFKQLVKTFGKGRVIWRFDPLILTDKITVDDLLRKVENIGNQLKNYTEKLVFSFADIAIYKKVKSNLEKNNINYSEWTENQMFDFAKSLSELNKKWNFQLATCGEKIDISQFGIQHNKCIDDDLMIRFAKNDKVLMDYLGVEIVNSLFDGEKIIKKKDNRDKGQRQFCGCIISKDIGEYNTCPHLCEYCYANTSKDVARNNYEQAKQLGLISETITGENMLIEQITTYAYKLKCLENPTFDMVRGFAKKFIDDLPKELVDELYSQLERGVVQIDSEPQMLVYLYSFGKMHQAKLHKAFENIPPIFFEQPVINIIDYGSEQAIGTMCYVDFLKHNDYTQKINKVTLFDPSENLLKLAALHVSKNCPDAEIITIIKHLEDLDDGDIVCDENIPTLHILYDLDWEFDVGNFAQVISNNLKGYNQFVCVGPCFNDPIADGLVDDFAEFFYINDKEDNYIKTFSVFELNPNESWSAHIRCFSVGNKLLL